MGKQSIPYASCVACRELGGDFLKVAMVCCSAFGRVAASYGLDDLFIEKQKEASLMPLFYII